MQDGGNFLGCRECGSGIDWGMAGRAVWMVLIAIVGTAGWAALAAIRAGMSPASKEILVMAGELVMKEAAKHQVRVLAVDSEHSAIFQCLEDKPAQTVRALWLTASGGPFRSFDKKRFESITVDQALKHPSWVMGRKITIDSATMFNKGLEMIEAVGFQYQGRSSGGPSTKCVHSMVEFVDGSMIAQMSTRTCASIQHARPIRSGSQ